MENTTTEIESFAQQPVPSNPTYTEPAAPEPKKKSPLIAIVMTLALVASVTTGYFIFLNVQKPQPITPPATIAPVSTVPDETPVGYYDDFAAPTETETDEVSYGIFYPYTKDVTINNPNPTIMGKINQTSGLFLPTRLGKELNPASQQEDDFLRFIPGRTKNLEVKIDGEVIPDVYAFAQFPTVLCSTTEADCVEKKSSEMPPLIFVTRPKAPLVAGNHTLTVSSMGKILGSMQFSVDTNYKIAKQNVPQSPDFSTVFTYFDENNNCAEGYYYDKKHLHIPLPLHDNSSLLYGISFPQSEAGFQDVAKYRVQIGFDNKRFDLFFPQSSAFFNGKTVERGEIPAEQALFLPKDLLFFESGKVASPWQTLYNYTPAESTFAVYPVDTSGYKYWSNAARWQTSISSGCDG